MLKPCFSGAACLLARSPAADAAKFFIPSLGPTLSHPSLSSPVTSALAEPRAVLHLSRPSHPQSPGPPLMSASEAGAGAGSDTTFDGMPSFPLRSKSWGVPGVQHHLRGCPRDARLVLGRGREKERSKRRRQSAGTKGQTNARDCSKLARMGLPRLLRRWRPFISTGLLIFT
ncbi:hypothetical protein LZ30DRAFT_712311 [Colletotrichum cereale]|nr:hypothetical protein LZ30DRAFT_712311 [Colletotrichum cereale]